MMQIEKSALDWLRGKNRTQVTIDIDFVQINTCCCSRMITFDISYGEPKDAAAYREIVIDGVRVFLPIGVKLPEDRDVTLKLKSTFGFKSLTVEGLSREKVFAC